MWKKPYDVHEEIVNNYSEESVKNINALFSLHCIIDDAMPSEKFVPREGWASAIIPSEYGSRIIAQLGSDIDNFTSDEVSFALLLVFYHHDFVIDINKSNASIGENLLREELINLNLRLPDRFGRGLYDIFNDKIGVNRPERLESQDVDELLKETENGVYQVGTLTVGPLGPIHSRDRRFVPPIRRLPLWHCSDTGCGSLHAVDLIPHESMAFDLATLIKRLSADIEGEPSLWFMALAEISSHNFNNRRRPYYDLPSLIGDCIPSSERSLLFIEALNGNLGPSIRRTLSSIEKHLDRGAAEIVVKKLTSAAQLQILLTLKDEELVNIIDKCIRAKVIKIPPAEIRKAKSSPPKLSSFYEKSTISMFGVRTDQDYPPIFLSNSIFEEYNNIAQLEDLAWKCRRGGNEKFDEAGDVIEYMMQHSPREIIKNLVLPSRPVTIALAKKINIELDPAEKQEHLIDRFLWKFGFNPPRYDYKYGRLKDQLRQLKNEVLRHRASLTEDDRDSIRGKGVNVFVSLEHTLEEFISFNIWLLSSDHFVETRFQYSLSDAVYRVSDVLGDKIQSGDHEIIWNRNGGNVFSTLLAYARAAAQWMHSLPDRDKQNLERPIEEIPHYVNEISQQFRFQHRELWADAAPIQLIEFSKLFGEIVSDLERSRLAEIRNGLDHYRNEDRFPAVDDIIACESRLSAVVDTCDINRFLPKYFWTEEMKVNSFGISEFVLCDYAGVKIAIKAPQPLVGLLGVGFKNPVIVPFGNLLGMPNSDLVLQVREESKYSKLWSNYPRRPPASESNLENNHTDQLIVVTEGQSDAVLDVHQDPDFVQAPEP